MLAWNGTIHSPSSLDLLLSFTLQYAQLWDTANWHGTDHVDEFFRCATVPAACFYLQAPWVLRVKLVASDTYFWSYIILNTCRYCDDLNLRVIRIWGYNHKSPKASVCPYLSNKIIITNNALEDLYWMHILTHQFSCEKLSRPTFLFAGRRFLWWSWNEGPGLHYFLCRKGTCCSKT
jgi:hypothetical protein